MILGRRLLDGRHRFKYPMGYSPHLIMAANLEHDNWDSLKGDPIWSAGFMMGGHELKHQIDTLLLILTVSGVTSGLGAPAGGKGGAWAQHGGAPLMLAGDGWKKDFMAKLIEESLLWRWHDRENSPVEFAGWWGGRRAAGNKRVSAPGSHDGKILVRWASGSGIASNGHTYSASCA
jgi:hypothetical protein